MPRLRRISETYEDICTPERDVECFVKMTTNKRNADTTSYDDIETVEQYSEVRARYTLREDEEIVGFVMKGRNIERTTSIALWKNLERIKKTKPRRTYESLKNRFMRNIRPVLLVDFKKFLTYEFVISFTRKFPEVKKNCNYKELLANLKDEPKPQESVQGSKSDEENCEKVLAEKRRTVPLIAVSSSESDTGSDVDSDDNSEDNAPNKDLNNDKNVNVEISPLAVNASNAVDKDQSETSDVSCYVSRMPYSREEDIEIIKYAFQDGNLEKVTVTNFWKNLEASKKTAPERSYQSLRNRFLRNIKFLLLSEYKDLLSEEWKVAFVKRFPEVKSNPSFKKFISDFKNVQERNEKKSPICKTCTIVIERTNEQQPSSSQVNNSSESESESETVLRDNSQGDGSSQEIIPGTPPRQNSASSTRQQPNSSQSSLEEEVPLNRDRPIETPSNQEDSSDLPNDFVQDQSESESLIRKTRNRPCESFLSKIGEKKITENIPGSPYKKLAENGLITINKIVPNKESFVYSFYQNESDEVLNSLYDTTKKLMEVFVDPVVDEKEFLQISGSLRNDFLKKIVYTCNKENENRTPILKEASTKPGTSRSVNDGKRKILDTDSDLVETLQQSRLLENMIQMYSPDSAKKLKLYQS